MGQQQTRGNNSPLKINHPKFYKTTFPTQFLSKQSHKMQVDIRTDHTNYNLWKQAISNKQKKFNLYKNLLLPHHHKYSNEGFCSKNGFSTITYDKFPYLLEQQINEKKQKKNTFSQTEIWKLLLSIVQAKNQFTQLSPNNSNNLGNINPQNVFFNEKRQVMLSCPLSWPEWINGYKHAILGQVAYLSPEDMDSLEIGAADNLQNKDSQIYPIGMTLLSVGITENLFDLYDFESSKSIKFNELNSKLSEWKSTLYYSEILRALVLNLLQKDKSSRLSFQQLSSFLQPHISNIESQKPLVIKNAPNKLLSNLQSLRKDLPKDVQRRFDKTNLTPQQSNIMSPINSINMRTINNPQLSSKLFVNNNNYQSTNSFSSPANRFKSPPTKFTYSNRPLDIVSPGKIVINQQNQLNGVEYLPADHYMKQAIKPRNIDSSDFSYRPTIVQIAKLDNNAQPSLNTDSKPQKVQKLNSKKPQELQRSIEIAQRLIQNDEFKVHFTDSQLQNRQSTQTEINKLQKLQQGFVNPLMKASFQQNNDFNYHTYAQIVIKSDFQSVWNQFINMVKKPDSYFPQLQDKLIVADNSIQIPPGRVKLEENKQQGKIHLQNLSSSCKGDILGGVSKKSQDQVQVWFNSSYIHNGKQFPKDEFFIKSLQKLKQNLQH